MNKISFGLISIILFFHTFLFAYSSNPKDFVNELVNDAIVKLSDKNFESLEKNSIDLYSSLKSIYLQDRENKIKNSVENKDEWGNLDN